MIHENHKENDERKKRILWISVSVIGGIIFFFWLFNISYNIKSAIKEKNLSEAEQNAGLLPEIKEQLGEIHSEFDKIGPTSKKSDKEE